MGLGTAAVPSVPPANPLLVPIAVVVLSFFHSGAGVLGAVCCSLGVACMISSVAVVCGGTCGDLDPPTRRCLAWVTASTPLRTIPASWKGLATGFSAVLKGIQLTQKVLK